ncbi:MAG: amino acid ABC transporter substrate-binding protein [Gloeocapsa sp. DLM2.Bin57]|nr:MAG: amino acid ABC transporter substrate-binding protein [Gloeocapsa sp. DLM2.Bin57]
MRFVKLKTLFLAILCLGISLPAQGNSTLDYLRENRVLKVGIRDDAIPFGYRSNQGNLTGMCIDFIAILRQQILAEIGQDTLTIRLIESSLSNRFRLVEENIVHLECGPNTIRENTGFKITFSEAFFVSGTQFLLKTSQRTNINLNSDLANVSLGVLRGSTTEKYLRETYPEANLVLFQGNTGRTRGVQAVAQGNIDAMVSDGILLLGEGIVLGFDFNQTYTLLPSNPLTCDYYGMILPEDDLEWRELVNEAIAEFNTTQDQWLTEIRDYFNDAQNYCQSR